MVNNGDGYDFVCWVPPLGYGLNAETGELEKTDILKRSEIKSEQYWERTPLPMSESEWDSRRRMEKARGTKIEAAKRAVDEMLESAEIDDELAWVQLNISEDDVLQWMDEPCDDLSYLDPVLKAFEDQEWKRRLCGVWVHINGKLTYITGTHYLFLNWWFHKGKYMEYRTPNRHLFYVWDWVVEDPDCLGLIEFTKRKDGKSCRAGVILYEYISRVPYKHGGIQSKTDEDAEELFQLSIIDPWRRLVDFFRPDYDTSLGTRPSSELRFFGRSMRSQKAIDEYKAANALESWIDFKSRAVDAYDGPELHRYVSDEGGKLKDIDINKRHERVMFASEINGHYVGKHYYTTTVEEMDSGGGDFQKLVQDSNPLDKNKMKSGRTNSGLVYIFWPAYITHAFDKYGEPKIQIAKKFYLNRRADLEHNSSGLSSFIRKNPFTVQEAFRIDDDKGLYNTDKLNKRLEYLMWNDVTERGNLMWEGGIQDTKVGWAKSKSGKWEIPKGFRFENENETNNVIKRGNMFLPGNKLRFVSGADPYDHDVTRTQDGRASKAGYTTLKKHDPMAPADDPFNNAFVCKYLFRPPMASIAHEDAIMQCVYFGSPILVEDNKPELIKYFKRRGYEEFLIIIPGEKNPGIPSTAQNKASLAAVTEEYIETSINKVYYRDLIEQWLKFNLVETRPFDLAMAAGWNLIADDRFKVKREVAQQRDVEEYFRLYKAS